MPWVRELLQGSSAASYKSASIPVHPPIHEAPSTPAFISLTTMGSRLPPLAPMPVADHGQAPTAGPAVAARAPPTTKQHHGASEWARLKPTIRALLFDDNLKIKDVVEFLEMKHHFKTTYTTSPLNLTLASINANQFLQSEKPQGST